MNTKPLRFLLSLTFLFLFSGCVTTPEKIVITSNVSVFHTITEKNKGSKVVVLPFKKELESSLEFQNYKKIIENNLQKNGFNIVQEKDTSDFIAFVSYGTGEGKESLFPHLSLVQQVDGEELLVVHHTTGVLLGLTGVHIQCQHLVWLEVAKVIL